MGASPMHRRLPLLVGVAATAVAAQACTLAEVTLVEAADAVVAEVYVQVSPGDPGAARAIAWLHRTMDGKEAVLGRPVPGADVLITSARGFSLELAETSIETCVSGMGMEGTGTCYATSAELAARLLPGDELTLEVALPGGGLLRGTSVVPGDFRLLGNAATGVCSVEALSPLEVRWTRSAGAWAYVNETAIHGLRAALEPQGIVVEKDPLYLLGLSISAADTTIVFPGEFGVFDRFDLDQGVALALQKGLPPNTWATVAITAADRNYVNWGRGGNFNPSGLVKVPSLRGDGTGVFATTVTRSFRLGAAATGVIPQALPCEGG
ncbi:MAG: hypothetical protein AMXMBFR53_26820 [Gemmatimonadota bacterium]